MFVLSLCSKAPRFSSFPQLDKICSVIIYEQVKQQATGRLTRLSGFRLALAVCSEPCAGVKKPHKHCLSKATRSCLLANNVQEDFLKGEEGRAAGEQRALPRPPPQMRQALPTDAQSVAEFNDSMAAYYHQVLPPNPLPFMSCKPCPSSPLTPCPLAYQDQSIYSMSGQHVGTAYSTDTV